jgi:glycerol-3-phosphate acyltransferase PlsY
MACVLLVRWLVQSLPDGWARSAASGGEALSMSARLQIVAGIFAVLGHNYTCWLRFKGGKGIATSAGVLIAWVPWGFLWAFAAWLFVFGLTKYVSLASIAAAAVLPFAVWVVGSHPAYIWITAGLSFLAIYKHKSNIQRLLSGTEHKFGARKASPAARP